MKGSDFVAVHRISNRANDTLAAVDATCEKVPEDALEHLEAQGSIRRVERKAPIEKKSPRSTSALGGHVSATPGGTTAEISAPDAPATQE